MTDPQRIHTIFNEVRAGLETLIDSVPPTDKPEVRNMMDKLDAMHHDFQLRENDPC